ncbi:hypothetical protein EJB05_14968, partial [Eragrostis curvula]
MNSNQDHDQAGCRRQGRFGGGSTMGEELVESVQGRGLSFSCTAARREPQPRCHYTANLDPRPGSTAELGLVTAARTGHQPAVPLLLLLLQVSAKYEQ